MNMRMTLTLFVLVVMTAASASGHALTEAKRDDDELNAVTLYYWCTTYGFSPDYCCKYVRRRGLKLPAALCS
nr:conotoxin precursor K [Conus ebraeus]